MKRLLSLIMTVTMICGFVGLIPESISVEAVGGEITEAQVVEKLNTLVSKYNGTRQKWSYNGGSECYAFAHIVFNSIFDLEHASIGSYTKGTEYKFNNINSNVYCIGTLAPGYSDSQLENLLDSVKPGDYIQLKRRSSGGPHSEIVRSIDPQNNSITIFDANTDGNNTVKVYTQHYFNNGTNSSFKNTNQGVSVYRFKQYKIDPNPPTTSVLQLDKSSYGIKDTINMSFSSDTSIKMYTLQIWKGDILVKNIKTSSNSYSLKASDLGDGDFGAYVTCENEAGAITSDVVSFRIAKELSNPQISINKTEFDLNETLSISASADGGVDLYSVQIWKGSQIVYQKDFTGHSISINCASLGIGDYGAYVSCTNASGTVTSKTVSFRIGHALSSPQMSIDKESVELGDSITVTVSADGGVDYYSIQIWKGNSVVYQKEFTGHSISVNSNDLGSGEYAAVVTCVNQLGTINTPSKNFTIYQGHMFGNWTTTKAATCTTDGEKSRTCSVCGKKETGIITKLGHSWNVPTYTWSSDYKTCTAKRVCKNDSSHVETENATITSKVKIAATCTVKGTTTYTATFKNSAFKTQTKDVQDIAATGHNWGTPTYTWSADGKTCTAKRVCKNDSSHVETQTVNSTSVVKTNPTCTTKGTTTYTAVFTNSAFSKQNKDVQNIAAIGHSWGEPTYTWSTDNKTCTATRICANDSSHKETETVNTTYAVTTASTEISKGVGTYTAKFNNSVFTTKTKTVSIPTLSHTHKWGNPTYSWSSDCKTCTATRVCTKDSSHKETETVNTSYAETIAPTETSDGVGTYTAEFSNNVFVTQTKTVSIAALNHTHSWSEPTYTWSSDYKTCTATRVCTSNSNHKETETVNSSTTVKTPATCTVKGTTTYTAIFTNKAFANQTKDVQDIAVKEHTWSEWKTTAFDATKGTSTQRRTCSICQKTETKTVDNAIQRLAGSGRYATAVEISKAGFPNGAKTVILAYGLNYADALAGVPLATAMNAPIMLTAQKSLPTETLAEIKRLKSTNVIILGGTGAISEDVEKELESLGLYTERIAGKTRFETATKIARKLQKINNKAPEEVFFVYAFNSADALSVSAVAAVKGAPVIYLKTSGELDDATAAYLKSIKSGVKKAYVIGGSGVISDDMMMSAGDILGVIPNRIFGKDRFATCVAVNDTFKDTLNGDTICVATGMDFPDALAGGVFAAMNKAPLFLINGKATTLTLSDTQKSYLKTKSPQKIFIFGGTGAVPDSHIQTVAEAS